VRLLEKIKEDNAATRPSPDNIRFNVRLVRSKEKSKAFVIVASCHDRKIWHRGSRYMTLGAAHLVFGRALIVAPFRALFMILASIWDSSSLFRFTESPDTNRALATAHWQRDWNFQRIAQRFGSKRLPNQHGFHARYSIGETSRLATQLYKTHNVQILVLLVKKDGIGLAQYHTQDRETDEVSWL
jgi:hypothetical protein